MSLISQSQMEIISNKFEKFNIKCQKVTVESNLKHLNVAEKLGVLKKMYILSKCKPTFKIYLELLLVLEYINSEEFNLFNRKIYE